MKKFSALLVLGFALTATAQQQESSSVPQNTPPPRSDQASSAKPSPDYSSSKGSFDVESTELRKAQRERQRQKQDQEEIQEMGPWDPHRAQHDVEVGDFYRKQGNYKGAMMRYQDALVYKSNDAIASFWLADSYEHLGDPKNAVKYFQQYLKILPNGAQAEDARKAIARLNAKLKSKKSATSATSEKRP